MNVDPIYHAKVLELRSMKDFAAVCQFLHMFHPAFALDDFDTEDLEQALVDPSSLAYLIDLQARMLRALTQDRRISFDNWIKYAQKEFESREEVENPWMEEDATHYEGFSLGAKLSILLNLCEWQLDDPERFRLNFKEDEEVAVEWSPKQELPTPKTKPKTTFEPRRGTRRSARGQKAQESPELEPESEFETPPITPGVEWEPVCISQQEWEDFARLFRRSKHPDEKALHSLVNNDILPKVLSDFKEKEKEREKLEAIANRKRSSRIVIRELELQEKARLDAIRQQEIQAAVEQRKRELRERRAERERQQQQQIRDNRLKEREQRLKAREEAIWEREARKKQKLQRIAKEREERKKRRLAGGHTDEHSEDESTNHQGEQDEEEDWVFDCVCGVHGNNLDDGELMIACGKCNVWQHVACLKQEDAAQGKSAIDWATVDFICPRCVVKEQKRLARKQKKEEKLRMEATASAGVAPNGISAPVPVVALFPQYSQHPQHPQHPQHSQLPQHPQYPQHSQHLHHPQHAQYSQYPQHPQNAQHSHNPPTPHSTQPQYAQVIQHPPAHSAPYINGHYPQLSDEARLKHMANGLYFGQQLN
ncbi:hypothetical protein EDD11_003438 [Mortierella claussenii]|nr:hypothetical protein EDD11_003438 [Mortierella claussenii]